MFAESLSSARPVIAVLAREGPLLANHDYRSAPPSRALYRYTRGGGGRGVNGLLVSRKRFFSDELFFAFFAPKRPKTAMAVEMRAKSRLPVRHELTANPIARELVLPFPTTIGRSVGALRAHFGRRTGGERALMSFFQLSQSLSQIVVKSVAELTTNCVQKELEFKEDFKALIGEQEFTRETTTFFAQFVQNVVHNNDSHLDDNYVTKTQLYFKTF